jgi:hypothetical protein
MSMPRNGQNSKKAPCIGLDRQNNPNIVELH